MEENQDISQEKKWLYEEWAEEAIRNLHKKNIAGQYVSHREEALQAVLNMIPPDVVVARGDSLTLEQIGVINELIKRGRNTVIDPFQSNADGYWVIEADQRKAMEREAFSADIFLTSTNAVTLNGILVNTDGHGNRVSAMIFGPKKVIIVAGCNKIVPDTNKALERIRHWCAPVNARRHYVRHHRTEFGDLPCVKTGRCVDCNHDLKICHYTVIIDGSWMRDKDRMQVILIGEELGI